MNMASALRHQAVNAAKKSEWELAVSLNQQILEQNPSDVSAYNRMGVAYMQIKNVSKAKKAFQQTLNIDKTNSIAKKQLQRINSNHLGKAPAFTKLSFIEEPGKTKTVELHRLAGKQVLNNLSVGQICELKPKKRYISVEVDGQYVGALPEDLSLRLAKLIETGNEYSCSIRSCNNNNQCFVYLKETNRSPENRNVHSFPPSKTAMSQINNDVEYLLDEIPVEVTDHDADDDDKNLDDVDTDKLDD